MIGHRFGRAILVDGPLEVALGRLRIPFGPQQKVNRVARLVHGSGYKYFHSPLTLIYVSSIRQLVPCALFCRQCLLPTWV